MVTNEQIEQFKQGALSRKDQAQINLARAALAGDASARQDLAKLIAQPQPRLTEQDPGPFGNGEQVDPQWARDIRYGERRNVAREPVPQQSSTPVHNPSTAAPNMPNSDTGRDNTVRNPPNAEADAKVERKRQSL